MAQHKRTLYISDLDGTLLNEQSAISRYTAQALNSLIDNGMLFTIATARTPATVVKLMEKVNLQLPAILMTGALVYDLARNKYLSVSSFDPATSTRIINCTSSCGISPMIYYIDNSVLHVAYNTPIDHRQQLFMQERMGTPYKQYVEVKGEMSVPANTVMIFFMGQYDKLQQIHNLILPIAGHRSYLYYDTLEPQQGYLEIYPEGTSKAQAITQLAQQLGADEIVAFGDNLNDIPMFDVAQRSYAPCNAIETVKHHASRIIDRNDNDGVAHFLQQDFKH